MKTNAAGLKKKEYLHYFLKEIIAVPLSKLTPVSIFIVPQIAPYILFCTI